MSRGGLSNGSPFKPSMVPGILPGNRIGDLLNWRAPDLESGMEVRFLYSPADLGTVCFLQFLSIPLKTEKNAGLQEKP